jgi:hypothetical protein
MKNCTLLKLHKSGPPPSAEDRGRDPDDFIVVPAKLRSYYEIDKRNQTILW